MVKRTYNNFLTTMSILENQCGMTQAEAEKKTRQIFDSCPVILLKNIKRKLKQ